jgi:hypothetical protein
MLLTAGARIPNYAVLVTAARERFRMTLKGHVLAARADGGR